MEKWLEEELSMIGSLSEEEARLEAEIKSKKLLLRLVKEQQVREVRDLVKRNADVLRLSHTAKKCYEKDCSGEAAGSLCSLLEEMLGCKQVLLTKVVQCGSMVYAWAISFRKLGKKNIDFVLEVPEADGINADYFDEANRGKFVLYRDNGSSHELIVQSYDFNIVKEAFKDEVKNGIQL